MKKILLIICMLPFSVSLLAEKKNRYYPKPLPDIHCLLKKNRIVPEGRECIYRCADKSRMQYIQKKRHKCPTRIFKKNKG